MSGVSHHLDSHELPVEAWTVPARSGNRRSPADTALLVMSVLFFLATIAGAISLVVLAR